MVVNWIAYSLILFSATMVGFTIARNYAERPRQIQELLSAVGLMTTEIVYGATPLTQALQSAARGIRGPVAEFFHQVSLDIENWLTAQEAWEHGLTMLSSRSALLEPELNALATLGNILGTSSREDQQRHLVTAMQRLEAVHKSAVLDSHNNERLWRYLGVMIGIVVVIILI
jgi:stage III sporulation protein AB